ncbi:MAG: hypothetical protein IPP15_04525 [Saprospiraceae bacterium]|uniref:Outer membrane protein beta-barrel domain-containing protein n=1 Tax=Candidatus Opimibacter skivensis TaxID=2982028 RepID=A0A9D7SVH7_9BACT|nr:hypothetical protein [Candidatus Opimibacter skivensis]
MKKVAVFLIMVVYLLGSLKAQAELKTPEPAISKLAGYHVGVVQIFFAINKGQTTFFDESKFYAIGFPAGITFNTAGKTKFDLEFVPFIKPHVNTDLPYQVHLLFHPGVLFPLQDGWTFGLRLAFEIGEGQFGFTPLLNKSFKLGEQSSFFVELVAPGRFGSEKTSGYTQLAGLHLGFGF